ncbi:MAG TPA: hypothetical protein VNJ08_04375 [Bacteriovoracaceae bacterium]|nr:hypothetical protein [Bacteriovoracaceae bacterium]
MKIQFIFLTLLLTFQALASTIVTEFANPSGKVEELKLREEAIEWVKKNVQGMNLLSEKKKMGIHYITSLFYDRLTNIDSMRPVYDELYRHMNPGDVSYSPFFVKEGIKIVILDKNQNVVDYPEYAHWKGKTVEEVFGYRGDLRLMDTIGGEATRNTCFLKEDRVGHFPRGSTVGS